MANEHILMVETDTPVNKTIADTGFEKGTLLTKTDPNTVTATSTKEAICGGVLAGELISGSGITSAAVYEGGKFKAVASGSITIGDALITSTGGANELETAGVNAEDIVGTSEETVTDGQTFLYKLNPHTVNLA